MLRLLISIAFAAAPVAAATSSLPTAPWWEKVTVTMTGDGKAQSCRYETSTSAAGTKECSVVGGDGMAAKAVSRGELARITFERRFSPGPTPPADGRLETGDTLLGRQVMALAIDSGGKVSGCTIVARSGDMTPDYGGEEAKAERFQASAGGAAADRIEGFMTILIYGHSEHVV